MIRLLIKSESFLMNIRHELNTRAVEKVYKSCLKRGASLKKCHTIGNVEICDEAIFIVSITIITTVIKSGKGTEQMLHDTCLNVYTLNVAN